MFTFIPNIREKRNKEMDGYSKKNISFISRNKYKLIGKINVKKEDVTFTFEVRVDFKDVRFYIKKSKSCIYLSIYEIYELLNDINMNYDIDVTDYLKTFCKNNDKDQFEYKGVKYKIPKSPVVDDKYNVFIPYSNIYISCTELFVLIFLVQEKSNYFWSLSDNIKYKDGIIYLLIVLLSFKEDNKLLNELGWYYSSPDNKYMDNKLSPPDKDNAEYKELRKKVERKYYLTKNEMNSILMAKNPSISSMTKH